MGQPDPVRVLRRLAWRDDAVQGRHTGGSWSRQARVIAGGSVVEGPPKTRPGARTVALDADTVRVMRAWGTAQLTEYMCLAVRPAHGLVFTGEDGGALWPQRTATDLGLPTIGVHGLRHSAAT